MHLSKVLFRGGSSSGGTSCDMATKNSQTRLQTNFHACYSTMHPVWLHVKQAKHGPIRHLPDLSFRSVKFSGSYRVPLGLQPGFSRPCTIMRSVR